MHVGNHSRIKLNKRNIPCIMLGISEESKTYRLYNPITKGIIVSRDVIFKKDKSWSWSEEFTQSIQTVLDWDDNDKDEEDVELEGLTHNLYSRKIY